MADASEDGGEKQDRKAASSSQEAPSPGCSNIEDVLKLTMELCRDPKTAPIAEAVASTLLTVIGIGPSFAAMQSLVAANQANGLMYHNAVANQQRTNIMGMVATMNCVNVLLDKPADVSWPGMPGAEGEGSL